MFLVNLILSVLAATECDCPSEIPNAEIQYTERDPGSIANYTCVAGYSSHDIFANIVCLDNGFWSQEPFECKRKFNNAICSALNKRHTT